MENCKLDLIQSKIQTTLTITEYGIQMIFLSSYLLTLFVREYCKETTKKQMALTFFDKVKAIFRCYL